MDTATTPPPPAAPPPPPAAAGTPPPAAAGGTTPPPAADAKVETKPAEGTSALDAAAKAETKPAEKPADAKPGEKPVEGAKPAELTVPKGFEPHVEAFKASAKELGLEGEKAQKFVDAIASIDAAKAKAVTEAFGAQDQKWLAEAKADPDIGGAKWDGAMKDVTRALKKYGGTPAEGSKVPPLAALLHQSGLGNNKHVLRFLAAIGRVSADDTISGTEKPAPAAAQRLSDADALYGPQNAAAKKDD